MIHNISMKKIILALLLSFNFILSGYADIDTCLNAYDSKVYKNILKECTTPANEGDSVSQNILGWWYLYGQEDTDYSKAFIWLSKSSDQGNTWAKGQIGLMYQNGTGVLKDYSKALIFLTDAGESLSPIFIESFLEPTGIPSFKKGFLLTNLEPIINA